MMQKCAIELVFRHLLHVVVE